MSIQSPLLPALASYIDGHWHDGDQARSLPVHNPVDGEVIAEVSTLNETGLEKAIAVAHRCFDPTATPPLSMRKQWLQAIVDGLQDNREEIGRILCLEHGKPLAEAQGEVDYAGSFFRYCAQSIDQLESHTLDEQPKDCRWQVNYRPVGVAALITPWNFPIAMIAKKLSAALAAGCPVVIKPASETPLTMIALFHLLDGIEGLPRGMANLVIGKASMIGPKLCNDERVAMISFTGSTGVGQQLMRDSADGVKKLALELGGNAPFIVFDDADLDAAADQLIGNKFRGGGQTCVCANRLLVHENVLDDFVGALKTRISRLSVGDGMQEGIDIGPLINRAGFDKVRAHTRDALSKGANLVIGPDPEQLDDASLLYPPTVITGLSREMKAFQEETFGPLVAIMRFGDDDEALSAANDTDAGLAAYFFTADKKRAERIIAGLRFGHVGYNSATGPTAEAPFGGMKRSGIGREGGSEGLFEFTEAQTVPTPA